MSEMKIGFELRKIRLGLEDILPMRLVKAPEKKTHRYKTILASIPVVGLVEPLVVYPQKDAPGKYMLKNGHLRYFALKDLGQTEADCIIATDDECYTYNARVSRLPPIQEHKMIVKAVNNGVSPERLATALNMPFRVVQASMNLLKGIHEDAAELLKGRIQAASARGSEMVTGQKLCEACGSIAKPKPQANEPLPATDPGTTLHH